MEVVVNVREEVVVDIDGYVVRVKGPKGELVRRLMHPCLVLSKKDNSIVIKSKEKKVFKRHKMFAHTFRAHINNMVKGVVDGFEYKMKICSGHFPMTVNVDKGYVVVKNFLGEKVPRRTKVIEGVNIKIDGDIIILSGIDKEKVAQMAAKIEQVTVIKNRDRRIFQDGCYIIEKAGKVIV